VSGKNLFLLQIFIQFSAYLHTCIIIAYYNILLYILRICCEFFIYIGDFSCEFVTIVMKTCFFKFLAVLPAKRINKIVKIGQLCLIQYKPMSYAPCPLYFILTAVTRCFYFIMLLPKYVNKLVPIGQKLWIYVVCVI